MAGPYEPVDSPDSTTIFPYHDLEPPTIADVYRARRVVRRHLPRTPLIRSEELSSAYDADVYFKREDTLPTGAFKVRGGITLVSSLNEEFRSPGLIAASTGNHGQSIAYAGRTFDVPVVIAVPEDANRNKVEAMECLGARVERHGRDFDDAREWAEAQATAEGYRYVHSANEPKLVAGVGTAGLEVVEDCPEVDYVFCPVGGGSGASGYCLTVGELTDATIVGVQSAAAPGLYRAWRDGGLDPHDAMDTFAEGLATRVPFALTMDVLRNRLDDFLLVEDDQLWDAMARLLTRERIVVEGASASGIAALDYYTSEIEGNTVVVQLSGRNVSPAKLADLLESA